MRDRGERLQDLEAASGKREVEQQHVWIEIHDELQRLSGGARTAYDGEPRLRFEQPLQGVPENLLTIRQHNPDNRCEFHVSSNQAPIIDERDAISERPARGSNEVRT